MPNNNYFRRCRSPLGELLITGNNVTINGLYLPGHRHYAGIAAGLPETDQRFAEVVRQLDEYFAGKRQQFELAVEQPGTEFQQAVWRELAAIPYGGRLSYGELSRRLQRPKAYRAVGSANGANQVAIVIPCHRVLASNGALSGYAGGPEAKAWLLAHEAKFSR
ncbi:methylated-DNA--[protein]-cysteine S-methyltransferase [Halioxenophilus sp. WMMB6]|uniref:methylated-DNA--[protein]-cysteine S-methyltransferase n=1 Tax=Halioxenophilus sp. WMMB6 TaxID=3073815 RepID=UPI00295F0D9F|nr:methylated-DNA--[protein]-cysteine S-methyltransferase [Halioxenophilus sp. WMMB6]